MIKPVIKILKITLPLGISPLSPLYIRGLLLLLTSSQHHYFMADMISLASTFDFDNRAS